MIPRRRVKEIELMREAGRIVFFVQKVLEEAVAPGITPLELDTLAEETIRDHGAAPAFKGYQGFPASICASVNAAIVHGIPDDTPLEDGDIISVDVGSLLHGFYGDGAFTLGVGAIDAERQHLLDVTRTCLALGIEQCRAGNHLSDISHAIHNHAAINDIAVVREFGGHGIGRQLHEDPHILNYGPPGAGPQLRAGYVFAIEPILTTGDGKMRVGDDGWTATTTDGRPAAHFEHTVAITVDGPDVLTLPDLTKEAAVLSTGSPSARSSGDNSMDSRPGE
jgi:methionyl aminopeptidase